MWDHLRTHVKDSEPIAEAVKTHDDEVNPPWQDNRSEKSDDTAENVESEKIESASMIELDSKDARDKICE